MSRPKRLLTLGHSYVVAMNRRLADEMAAAGGGEWEVTAVAPERYPADLREMALEPIDGERCRTVAVPVRAARRPQLMRWGRALRELLREPWDVVHAWQEPYVAASWQLVRWMRPEAAFVPATFQNLPKRYPPPFSLIERRTMRRADGWIAFARTVEETLAGRPGYRDRPHAVIPPGVDLARFRADDDARARLRHALGDEAHGSFVAGYLGRFVESKGLRVMMDALERAGDVRALFVGGGEMEGELRAWAERRPNVRIATGVAHDEVPAYLNAMDALVAPSLTTPRWREQFGRMLIEAMACGVPVVASDSGEIPHVVGDAGIIVPEGDAGALAAALRRLKDDPAETARLAEAGERRARTDFALDVVARRHLEFFERVMTEKARRG